jgi:hypothetical protein
MNIHKMISELQAEKQRLDEAIGALERLSAGSKNKRRPKAPKDTSEEDRSTNADVPHSSTH